MKGRPQVTTEGQPVRNRKGDGFLWEEVLHKGEEGGMKLFYAVLSYLETGKLEGMLVAQHSLYKQVLKKQFKTPRKLKKINLYKTVTI